MIERRLFVDNMFSMIRNDKGRMSDGSHTFDELYDHRIMLYICLMHQNTELSWKAFKHDNGEVWDDWFVAGMKLPTGDVTYHIPNNKWDMLNVEILERAPRWDGHSASDVLYRLEKWTANNGK